MFTKFGVGIVLYFKQFRYLFLLTALMSVFAVPGLVLYILSTCCCYVGNPRYTDAVTVYGINRKSLAKTTLGNLGRGGYACGNGKLGDVIHLSCPYSAIHSLVSAGYGSADSRCSSEAGDLGLEEHFSAGHEVFAANAANCVGYPSCSIALNFGGAGDRYVFVNALCKNTEVILSIGGKEVDVKKTYIVLVAAGCDFVAIVTFALGVMLYLP